MKMEFYAEINETDNSEGVQMGHIELKMADGETVWVDADETEWSEEEDGSFDILLRGVYIMGDEDDDYNVDPADFKGATITDIYIDDDTEKITTSPLFRIPSFGKCYNAYLLSYFVI